MMKMSIVALGIAFLANAALAQGKYVPGYVKSDGTYVSGHYRSSSGSSSSYSPSYAPKASYPKTTYSSPKSVAVQTYKPPKTYAPIKTYTPAKTYTPPGVQNYQPKMVSGSMRRDGTYVAPHFRSSANSSVNDNWGTKGNANPFTGKSGTGKQQSPYEW